MTTSTTTTPPRPVEASVALVRNLLRGRTDRRAEAEILAILRTATAPELAEILAQVDLAALIGGLDDRVFGPDHRRALLELLTVARLAELGVGTRARLVAALAERMSGDAVRALRAVVLDTRGADLTFVKNAIDGGWCRHDLKRLVFHEIRSAEVRAEILAHIAAEAAASPSGEIKVLSDVDDTFFANWKDDRFPPKTVYPGVRQFYAELDRGPHEIPGRPGDLAFLTARPGMFESSTARTLRERGVVLPTILEGSTLSCLCNRMIAGKKLDNFERYRALYPEYGFVLIGDSGQGDVRLAERMLASAPDAVRAAFIHDVVATPPDRREACRPRRIFFFDTYLGATLEAWRIGLVQREALDRVAEVAAREIAEVAFVSEAQRDARRQDLARDVDLVRSVAGAAREG
jgi:hypothetical protein